MKVIRSDLSPSERCNRDRKTSDLGNKSPRFSPPACGIPSHIGIEDASNRGLVFAPMRLTGNGSSCTNGPGVERIPIQLFTRPR